MRTLTGLVMVGGLVLGMTGESKAQFSLSIGNPYYGSGVGIGTPGGYSYGYPNYSSYGYSGLGYPGSFGGYNSYYNSGILGGPGGFSYSSGYRGVTTPVAPLSGYGYGYGGVRPYYSGYAYPGYGYGYRNGFRPFRGVGRVFR